MKVISNPIQLDVDIYLRVRIQYGLYTYVRMELDIEYIVILNGTENLKISIKYLDGFPQTFACY